MPHPTTPPQACRPAAAPRGRAFRLYLTIDGFPYLVRPLAADPGLARRAFRLTKPDGTGYDVSQGRHGPRCDCPDFLYRRDGVDPAGCKHVRALVSCGLLERDVPEPPASPSPARR